MYPIRSHLFVSCMPHANQPWWCHGSLHQYWKVISSSSCVLQCTVYHMLGSISNLPQDWLDCSCYLSENRLPNSVIKFLWKLAHNLLDCSSRNLPQVASIMYHLLFTIILWQLDTHCWAVLFSVVICQNGCLADMLANACNRKQLGNESYRE